jgi:hypothetical protein
MYVKVIKKKLYDFIFCFVCNGLLLPHAGMLNQFGALSNILILFRNRLHDNCIVTDKSHQ